MLRIRCRRALAALMALWCAGMLYGGAVVSAAIGDERAPAAESAAESPAKWVGVLRSPASTFQKATACRMLAVFGDKDAVAALAELLTDKQLAAHARTALEMIPSPEAVDALRAALPRLDGDLLVGAIGSIGKRRDPRSVETLTTLLSHREPKVAGAAARALGEIGTAAAADALGQAMAGAGAPQRAALAIGCLVCAERLVQRGQGERAAALCDAVRTADVPPQAALAATQRAIVARGRGGVPLLTAELASSDEARFRLALQAARELGGVAGGALTARVEKESPQRRMLLIVALGDIGDRAALTAILGAARQGPREIRIAAIAVLGRWNEAQAVPVLLAAMNDPEAPVVDAARGALAQLNNDAVNGGIVRMLDGGSVGALREAIALAGQRGLASATPALFRLAERADVSEAAVKALGATVSIDDLPKLIALATASENAGRQAAARKSLRHACVRLPREASLEKLVAAMTGASTGSRAVLLESMAAVGGRRALEEIVAAARSPQDALQDVATRLLGGWMTPDAGPKLLELSKTLGEKKYKVRALRGYIRIARQLNMTPAERLAMCRAALAAAERREEKSLAVEALGRVGTAPAMALAASLLDDKEMQAAAGAAVVALSDAVAAAAPEETEKTLAKVLGQTTSPALKAKAERQIAKARELSAQRREETMFAPLFDGRTLAGWVGDRSVFRVEDGAIVGGNLKRAVGGGNDFLSTTREFGDFELRLQVRLLGNDPNGGVNFRSKRDPQSGVAAGYQADIGQNVWGCLYDEARRNRVIAPATPAPTIGADPWNDYRICCEGRRIRLWVNGMPTVDYTEADATIPTSGILALQVQAGHPCEVWYRNLRIRELGKTPAAGAKGR